MPDDDTLLTDYVFDTFGEYESTQLYAYVYFQDVPGSTDIPIFKFQPDAECSELFDVFEGPVFFMTLLDDNADHSASNQSLNTQIITIIVSILIVVILLVLQVNPLTVAAFAILAIVISIAISMNSGVFNIDSFPFEHIFGPMAPVSLPNPLTLKKSNKILPSTESPSTQSPKLSKLREKFSKVKLIGNGHQISPLRTFAKKVRTTLSTDGFNGLDIPQLGMKGEVNNFAPTNDPEIPGYISKVEGLDISSQLIYNKDFKIELDTFGPNQTLPMHVHNDTDVIGLPLSGDLEYNYGKGWMKWKNNAFKTVGKGIPHSVRSGEKGGVFLSIYNNGGLILGTDYHVV